MEICVREESMHWTLRLTQDFDYKENTDHEAAESQSYANKIGKNCSGTVTKLQKGSGETEFFLNRNEYASSYRTNITSKKVKKTICSIALSTMKKTFDIVVKEMFIQRISSMCFKENSFFSVSKDNEKKLCIITFKASCVAGLHFNCDRMQWFLDILAQLRPEWFKCKNSENTVCNSDLVSVNKISDNSVSDLTNSKKSTQSPKVQNKDLDFSFDLDAADAGCGGGGGSNCRVDSYTNTASKTSGPDSFKRQDWENDFLGSIGIKSAEISSSDKSVKTELCNDVTNLLSLPKQVRIDQNDTVTDSTSSASSSADPEPQADFTSEHFNCLVQQQACQSNASEISSVTEKKKQQLEYFNNLRSFAKSRDSFNPFGDSDDIEEEAETSRTAITQLEPVTGTVLTKPIISEIQNNSEQLQTEKLASDSQFLSRNLFHSEYNLITFSLACRMFNIPEFQNTILNELFDEIKLIGAINNYRHISTVCYCVWIANLYNRDDLRLKSYYALRWALLEPAGTVRDLFVIGDIKGVLGVNSEPSNLQATTLTGSNSTVTTNISESSSNFNLDHNIDSGTLPSNISYSLISSSCRIRRKKLLSKTALYIEEDEENSKVPVVFQNNGNASEYNSILDSRTSGNNSSAVPGSYLRFGEMTLNLQSLWQPFEELERKRKSVFTETHSSEFNIAKVIRIQDGKDLFPKIFELRADKDDDLLLIALKRSHTSSVLIYAPGFDDDDSKLLYQHRVAASNGKFRSVIETFNAYEYAKNFVGSVHPNFWGHYYGVCDYRGSFQKALNKCKQKRDSDVFSENLSSVTSSDSNYNIIQQAKSNNLKSNALISDATNKTSLTNGMSGIIAPINHLTSLTKKITTSTFNAIVKTTINGSDTVCGGGANLESGKQVIDQARLYVHWEPLLEPNAPRKIDVKLFTVKKSDLSKSDLNSNISDATYSSSNSSSSASVLTHEQLANNDINLHPCAKKKSDEAEERKDISEPETEPCEGKIQDYELDNNKPFESSDHTDLLRNPDDDSITLHNLQPRYSKRSGSYVLPFFGRVALPSAKNIQLVHGDNKNNIYLLFGKQTENMFALDFRSPLSVLDAFGIALASFAKKRAVS